MAVYDPIGQEQNIDGRELDDITRGAVVVGTEAIDWPLTDGIYLYLRLPGGELIALLIETESADPLKHELLRITKTAAVLQEA